jgi:nucleoside phosphorylase/glycosyltransferase involved in cell wall biosynthesis
MSQDRYKILFLMEGWSSSAGGIQTFNREFACAVASARPEVECVVISPTSSESEREDAFSKGVTLISGADGSDWQDILLSTKIGEIPSNKVVAIVGHSYFSGREAIQLRERFFPDSVGIHFIHMSPLHTESLKEYRAGNYVTERESKVAQEIAYASQAGLIFCVGPRLHRYMHDLLTAKHIDANIIVEVDCGFSRPPARERVKPIQPKLLCLGRTDSVGVKGIDIFAYAAGLLTNYWVSHPATSTRPPPEFIARGAKEKPEQFENHLATLAQGAGRRATIRARPYTSNRDELEADFRGSSIFVMPSREEGFGLVACEALSLGVPTLVSAESGIGEVIARVANDAHMHTDKCVISMDGDVPAVAKRYADAALAILMDESKWLSYFQVLQERLLPVCSWEAGARQFLARLEKSAPNVVAPPPRPPNGPLAQEAVIEPADANMLLQQQLARLMAIPGVVGTGIKQAIVVYVEPGSNPPVPTQIGGVDVIVSQRSSVRLSNGDQLAAGDGLLIDGKRVASIGAFVSDKSAKIYALTVAHAITGGVGQTAAIVSGSSTRRAFVHLIDRELDVALLELPEFDDSGSLGGASPANPTSVASPKIGSTVRLYLAERYEKGTISSTDMSLRVDAGDVEPKLYQGMFEVRLSTPIEPGASGAPIVDDRGALVGMLVAAVRHEGSMQQALATPIDAILRKLDLSIATRKHKSKNLLVGILATSDNALIKLLAKVTDPRRISKHGDAYFLGNMGDDGPGLVISSLPRIGNIGSAIVTTKLLSDFDVDYMMMLGTCGGLQPSSQSLGDVIVSSDVLYYEPGSIGPGEQIRRTRIAGTTPYWLSKMASEVRLSNFVWPAVKAPIGRIFVGSLASGEKIVRDADALRSLLGEFRSALGVEMEAAGMAEAVSASGRNVPFVVVRGISDFPSEIKEPESRIFQDLATERAVNVGTTLLASLPAVESLAAEPSTAGS